MKKRTLGFVLLTLTLCAQLALPARAFAAEELPAAAESTLDSNGELTATQTYTSIESEPEFPETITEAGTDYELSTAVSAPDPSYQAPTQDYTRQAFSQVPLEGINNLGAYFPATYPIDDGEYQGEIPLAASNPFSIQERYHSYRVQVDRQVVYTNLPDNDVNRIPATGVFEVVSDTTPGATMASTLQLLGVSYEIAGTDHLGLPNNYTAYATYRGQEGLHELAFYDVTAHYSGTLTSNVDQLITTATYLPVEAEEDVAIVENEVPLAEPELPLFPLAIAGTTIVVLLAFPLLYVLALKNARLVRTFPVGEKSADDEGVGEEQAISEQICKRRLVLQEGVATFRIPPHVDIFDGAQYALILKPRIATRDGHVQMVWRDKIAAVLPLAEHSEINFRELLITSAEAAIKEWELID